MVTVARGWEELQICTILHKNKFYQQRNSENNFFKQFTSFKTTNMKADKWYTQKHVLGNNTFLLTTVQLKFYLCLF